MGKPRTRRDEFFDGVGVPPGMLQPGLRVMVPVGSANAVVNGGPSIVALAVAVAPVNGNDPDPDEWWFDVYTGSSRPLPQTYRVEQLLGVPAWGISAPGAPAGDEFTSVG